MEPAVELANRAQCTAAIVPIDAVVADEQKSAAAVAPTAASSATRQDDGCSEAASGPVIIDCTAGWCDTTESDLHDGSAAQSASYDDPSGVPRSATAAGTVRQAGLAIEDATSAVPAALGTSTQATASTPAHTAGQTGFVAKQPPPTAADTAVLSQTVTSDTSTAASTAERPEILFGFKREVVRCIANLSFKNRAVQVDSHAALQCTHTCT